MAENEKALIDAAAELHQLNPDYATGFLDGVLMAAKAAKKKEAEDAETEASGD